MKKEVKIIIFVVGLVLTLLFSGAICYNFNNYLKGYYIYMADEIRKNPQKYVDPREGQRGIEEKIQTYTDLSQQTLNGEEPVVIIFGIMCWVLIYCIVIANVENAIVKSKVKQIKEKIKS